MKNVVVVNKETFEKNVFNADQLSLNTASIIHLKVKKDDVAEFIQQGNTLIIKLKNGEILVLEKFFEKNKENVTSDLVFEDDACAFLWFNFENGLASFQSVSGLEALLPAVSTSVFSGMTPWLLGGGALLGGIAAGAGGGGGSGSENNTAEPISEVKIKSINTVEAPSSKDSGTVVSGTATPNSEIIVTVNGEVFGPSRSDGEGSWEVITSKPINEIKMIDATIPSSNLGNPKAKDSIDVPYISINPVASDDIINQQESLNGTTKLTGSWIYPDHPNAVIQITVNGQTFTPNNDLVISADGTWSLDIPTSLFQEGKDNKVTAEIFNEENVSNSSERDVSVDTVLNQPKIVISEKGVIEIKYPEDQGVVDIDTSEIRIYDSFGVQVKVDFNKVADGELLRAQLPEGLLGEIKVVVPNGSYLDWAGNIGTETTASAKVDTDHPAVKITIRENGEIVLTYPKDVDITTIDISKVKVYDNNGNIIPQLDFVLKSDGSYQAKMKPDYDNKVKVIVPSESYSDLTGNSGITIQNEGKVDTLVPTVEIDIAQPHVNGEAKVTFTFSEKIDPESFTAEDIQVKNGVIDPTSLVQISETQWQANAIFTPGSTLTVGVQNKSYTDVVGNEGLNNTSSLININIDSIVPNGNNSSTIHGRTEPNQSVEITLLNGSKKITESLVDGSWSIIVDDSTLKGESITATTSGANPKTFVSDTKKLPFVSIDIISGNDVIEIHELNELKTLDENQGDKGLDITGHVINPNQKGLLIVEVDGVKYVQGQDNGKGKLTVSTDGSWTLHIQDNTEILDRTSILNDPLIVDKKTFNVEAYLIESETSSNIISNVAERHPVIEHDVPKPEIKISANGKITVEFVENIDQSEDYADLIHVLDNNGVDLEVVFTQNGNIFTGTIQKPLDENVTVNIDKTYTNKFGDIAHEVSTSTSSVVIQEGPVDTIAPNVEVKIDTLGNITLIYDKDVDITQVYLSQVKITDTKDNPLSLGSVWRIGTDNTVTAQVKVPNGSKVEVIVPDNSYEDEAGNKGKGNRVTSESMFKAQPTVFVDYVESINDVDDTNSEDGIDQIKVFSIKFSEAVEGTGGEDIKQYLAQLIDQLPNSNIKSGSVIVTCNGQNEYLVKVKPEDQDLQVKIVIENDQYQDKYDNTGLNSSNAVSDGLKAILSLTESRVDTKNAIILGEEFKFLTLKTDNNHQFNFLSHENGMVEGIVAKSSSLTKYGDLKFNPETQQIEFRLNNELKETQALKQGEVLLEEVSFSYVGVDGKPVNETVAIKITGTNDAPVIQQVTEFRSLVTEANSTFSSGTLSNPTVTNSKLENRHPITFKLEDGEASTTQIYVNLKVLDNSFKVVVNGKTIHLNEVFQIEAGDKTTPMQVPLKFADGTWLASGAPWNANENGLSRFQIIISEDGVRFFGTKTTKSQYLEEVFYDASYANGIQLPEFKIGDNLLEIVSVDGIGIDSIQGYATITAGGKFALSDVDSEYLSKVELTLYNGSLKTDTFIPVLPKGISYLIVEEGENLKLTLSGKVSVTDYEDALNSLMYKGSVSESKEMTLKIFDDLGAFDTLDGRLDYKVDSGTVKITSFDFQTTNTLMFNENSLEELLNNLSESTARYVENDFKFGSSQKIDVSALLSDSANEANLQDYIFLEYDNEKDTAIISIDRDGTLEDIYQKQELLVLTNQKQAFDLEDLLASNQIVF